MLRMRFLILLSVCFLGATATWADEIGYVDCASHSEGAPVFGKPRKSNDVVATVACGERFTILVYGFYFSRIQTKDGQVGFVYSNLIAQDRGATSLPQTAPQAPQRPAQPAMQQAPALQMASDKTKIPRTPPLEAEPAPAAAAQAAVAATAPAAASTQPTTPEIVVGAATAASSAATSSPASAATAAETAAGTSQPAASVSSAQPQPASTDAATQPAATADTTVASPAAPTAAAPAPAEANPPATAQPEPATAQPEAEPAPPAKPAPVIKPADKIETWEKPRPSVRTAPLIELYGGYSFSRFGGASNGTNLNGAMGSFGWNVKSWLQIVADTSYSFQSVGGTKNVIYGNHYGPRFFRRMHNRWNLTPFAEGLVGGSDAKTTVSGAGGYTASSGATLSYKVGGGIDMHPSHRWDIRLFDVDYYRTSFGTNTHQNNYWISTGVVLRLFGGGAE